MSGPADPAASEAAAGTSFESAELLAPGGLRNATVRGAAWMAGSRVSQQVIQLGVTVILARLLVPRDFGLVGMIAIFTGFAAFFVDAGFGAALVQRKELSPGHLSTAFWLNLGSGLGVSGLLAAASPLVALFYHEPQLTLLMSIAGLNYVLAGLTIVQTSLLLRAMQFRRIALIENAALGCSGAAAVAAALGGLGVWSLVVLTLVSTGVRSVLLWSLSGWRPTRSFDRAAFRHLWGFGSRLLGSNVLYYWSSNTDNLLVGRFAGPAALGIYGRAYTLMILPSNQVSGVLVRTLFPALSRIQDDPERVRRAYLRAVGLAAFFTLPLATGVVVAAKPLVLTLLGPKWTAVVPLVQILAVAMAIYALGTTAAVLYQSQGRTDRELRWQAFALVTAIVFFGVGVHWGIKGVAVAGAVRSIMLLYPYFAYPGKLIDLRFADVARTALPMLPGAVLSAGTAWMAGRMLPGSSSPGRLAAEVAAATVVYLAYAHVARLEPYQELVAMIRRRRRTPASAATALADEASARE